MQLFNLLTPIVASQAVEKLLTIQETNNNFLVTEFDIGENHGTQSTTYTRTLMIQTNFREIFICIFFVLFHRL